MSLEFEKKRLELADLFSHMYRRWFMCVCVLQSYTTTEGAERCRKLKLENWR